MPFRKGNQLGAHQNHINNCKPERIRGTRWVHKDGKAIRVPLENIEACEADGWIRGRLPFTDEARRNQSVAQFRRRKPVGVKWSTYWKGKTIPEEIRALMRKPKRTPGKLEKYGVTQEQFDEAKVKGLKWCIFHKAFEPRENFNNPNSGNPCRKERRKGISKTSPERHKFRIWNRYRMEPSQYQQLLDKQGGKCALCGAKPNGRRLGVDHDHACCDGRNSCGECWRGLLCDECNQRLGRLEGFMKTCTISAKEGTWEHRALAYLKSYEPLLTGALHSTQESQ